MLYLFDYSVDDVGKVENVPDDLIFPIFGYLESHSNFSFVLLFTYLFTLLHNKGVPLQSLDFPSPLPIADFVLTPGLVLRSHPSQIWSNFGVFLKFKLLPVSKDDFS